MYSNGTLSKRLFSMRPSIGAIEDWMQTGMVLEFLGTSSARPTATRNVSSLVLHHSSGSFMFDCGDGTIRQMLSSSVLRPSRIAALFITHLHADHFYGLPSVCLTVGSGSNSLDPHNQVVTGNNKRTVYGPPGLRRLMGPLIERHVDICELRSSLDSPKFKDGAAPFTQHVIHENDVLQIAALLIRHTITCFGYIVRERPIRHIDAGRLTREFGLPPGPIYKRILNRESIISPSTGQPIPIDAVMQETPGRTAVILGDTRDPSNIAGLAANCDVLVHEATGTDADRELMLSRGHSTGTMAGQFAKSVGARRLVLTHFSPRDTSITTLAAMDERSYQRIIVDEAKMAAGPNVLISPAHDHMLLPVPRKGLPAFVKATV